MVNQKDLSVFIPVKCHWRSIWRHSNGSKSHPQKSLKNNGTGQRMILRQEKREQSPDQQKVQSVSNVIAQATEFSPD